MEPLPPTPEAIPLLGGIVGALAAHAAGLHAWVGALVGLAVGFAAYEWLRRSRWKRFAVLPWEFNVRGQRARARGDLQTAARELDDGLELHPHNAALLYNAACIASLRGETLHARELLSRAAERDPRAPRWAAEDEDLAATMAAWPANAQSA